MTRCEMISQLSIYYCYVLRFGHLQKVYDWCGAREGHGYMSQTQLSKHASVGELESRA